MVLGDSCGNFSWAPPPPQGLRPTAWEPQCQSPKEVDIFLSVLGTTWGPWQRLNTAQVFFPLRYGACAVRSMKSEFSRQSDLSLCSHCPVFLCQLWHPHLSPSLAKWTWQGAKVRWMEPERESKKCGGPRALEHTGFSEKDAAGDLLRPHPSCVS